VPLVRKGDKWSFDSKAGRQELLYRRIGANEFDGVVYQKDSGPATLDEFEKMERFNPDKSWTPVPPEEEESSKTEVAPMFSA